jgi:hypothetical protein
MIEKLEQSDKSNVLRPTVMQNARRFMSSDRQGEAGT